MPILHAIIVFWVAIVGYDLTLRIPDFLRMPVVAGWFVTLFVLVKLRTSIGRVPLYLQFLAIIVSSAVDFGAFGMSLELLSGIAVWHGENYRTVLLFLMQSALALAITAAVVASFIVVVFKKRFLLPVVLTCLPSTVIQVHGLLYSESLVGTAVLLFEIPFRLVVTYGAVVWLSRALANYRGEESTYGTDSFR